MTELEKLFKEMIKKKKSDSKFKEIKIIPQNEFESKHTLITNDEIRSVEDLSVLVNKELALAYIDDAKTLQLRSAEFRLVIMPIFQAKQRATDQFVKAVMTDLFNFYFIPFIAELKMTRALKGRERRHQANEIVKEKEDQGFSIKSLVGGRKKETDDEAMYG